MATHNIATQTVPSSTSKSSTCTVSTQTASPPCAPAHPIEASITLSNERKAPKLNWADDVDAILPIPVLCSPPPHDLSTLSTGATQPFGTLHCHVNHSHSHLQQPQQSYHFTRPPFYTRATPVVSWGPTITHSHPSGIASGKPVFTVSSSIPGRVWASTTHLDWDQDPWLFDLSSALWSLGWIRACG